VAESFGDLDPHIDARVNDVAHRADWRGFHRIEQILWVGGTTAATGRYGAELVADVAELHRRAARIDYQPAQLAGGAIELLNEIAASKITGEEERYSHTDLSDFHANLEGALVAFDLLRPALRATGHARLGATIAARFASVEAALDRYRRPTPLGYALPSPEIGMYTSSWPDSRSSWAKPSWPGCESKRFIFTAPAPRAPAIGLRRPSSDATSSTVNITSPGGWR
jgi:iron uptake system component EfeO